MFFTSAKMAYAASAERNGIADPEEKCIIDEDFSKITGMRGKYYQQDRCALSEIATKNLIGKSDTALGKAMSENDKVEVFHIASGVYALENEILVYGEKYASAVRAYAIIDSVDKALANMNKNANTLKSDNQKNREEVNKEIQRLNLKVKQAIEKAGETMNLKPNTPLDAKILSDLQMDSLSIYNIVKESKEIVGERLHKWFLGIAGKVRVKSNQHEEISSLVNAILDNYSKNFIKAGKTVLKKQRDNFEKAVFKSINDNVGISDEEKKYIFGDINLPNVSLPSLQSLIDQYKKEITKSAILKFDIINKEKYLYDFEIEMRKILSNLHNTFEKIYKDEYTKILNMVETTYINNLN